MRENAHIETSASPLAASGGAAGRVASARQSRLDDLMREIGGRGIFGARAAPLFWGFGGFLIGAAFWHAIGFWGFLSDVVLKVPEPQVSVIARADLQALRPNCTALALNRATGETTSVPCAEQLPFLEEAGNGRQDLAFAGARHHDVGPASLFALERGGGSPARRAN